MGFVTQVFIVLFGYVTLFYGVLSFHNDPKCGQNYNRNPRIVGGDELREGEFPWYVSIKETGQHECGGFIINRKVILTAAHCFKDFSDRATNAPVTISVTLAAHSSSINSSEELARNRTFEQDVKVRRIVRHPHYDAFSHSGKFDIALLLLENKIHWNQATKPVCLPTRAPPNHATPTLFTSKSVSGTEFKGGEVAVVAGWGTNTKKDNESESTLQKVRLTLYSAEECRRVLQEKNVTLKTDIDSSVICAGSNHVGFDSCSGDSGSALLVKRGRVWVAIGIVSSGFGKCGNGRPGLYTRISSYLDWIDLHDDQITTSFFFQKFASSFVSKRITSVRTRE